MLQLKLTDLLAAKSLRKAVTVAAITGLLISPLAGQAEDNPVTRLQQRSASKRFQQMKSQHQQWESATGEEHTQQAADDWTEVPARVQRRSERQQTRLNQRSDESQFEHTAPPVPAQLTPVAPATPANKPATPEIKHSAPVMSFPAADATPAPELKTEYSNDVQSGVNQQQLIPLKNPNQLIIQKQTIIQDQWLPATSRTTLKSIPPKKVDEKFLAPEAVRTPEIEQDLITPPVPVSDDTVFPLFEPFIEAVPPPPAPAVHQEDHVTQRDSQNPVMRKVSMTQIREPSPDNLAPGVKFPGPKKISEISPFTDYQPEDTIDPNNIEGSKLCEISNEDQACPPRNDMEPYGSFDRNSAYVNKYWYASCITYNPLYFEDVTLERYGHEHGPLVQPFVSVGKFGGQLFGLPYQWVMHPLMEEVSPLGYYRPGEPAPEMLYQVPLNTEAAAATGAFYTGMIFLIP